MAENGNANASRHDEDSLGSIAEYLKRAKAAEQSGDALLGMYLYLAAFEEAAGASDVPSEAALTGLKQAWALACTHKERSLAEYIFERLEPYLTAEEIALCTEALHNLALDKLAEFGLSREELEDVAQMISGEMLGMDEPVVRFEHIMTHKVGLPPKDDTAPAGLPSAQKAESDDAPADPDAQASIAFGTEDEMLDYDSIAGYKEVVKVMRDLGIGMGDDEEFDKLVQMLNKMHGLSTRPALDTIVLRSAAREDANRFMMATLGELDRPCVHMRMEESYQGMPLLCVSAHAVDIPKMGGLGDVLQNGGVLVLEDLDLWGAPMSNTLDEGNAFIMMQLTRGAREAVSLIQSAVDNPDVFVIVTASSENDIDDFFAEMLEPTTLIDIDFPTPEERIEIWSDIARDHPSIRAISISDLVRLSANMPRFDIYMAAREAVEEAYKAGLMARKYQPVTRDNLFDKLAAYQPLESDEYAELENAVVRDFRADIGRLEDLLEDEGL